MRKEELQLILEEGEGYKIEFKESLANIDRELVAFANSSGGRIFFGITDNKELKGVGITNKLKSQIQDIANNCEPRIKIILEEFEDVLIIEVREGEDKPYKCASGFYTRVGPNSQKMNRNEIIEFFKEEGKIRFDELVNLKFDYDTHFDEKKLDKFLRLAGISRVTDTPSILVNLGVAEKQEGRVIFNNTGIFFFSKNLQDIYYHTAVTCALYKGIEKVEVLDRRDFNEDIVSNIDGAMNFLKQYIPVRYEMTGEPRRKEIPEVPYDALREAIINAVAHRNYFEKGTNVMVEMFDDRIEITDFGGLPKGLTPKEFGKKSVLRNPNIAGLLHRIEYIEKMGTGINKMRRIMSAAGLPPIEFEFTTFFTVIFRRPSLTKAKVIDEDVGVNVGVNVGINVGVKGERLERILWILEMIYEGSPMNIDKSAKLLNITSRTLERDFEVLRKKELIEFVGVPKTGKYMLTKKGKKLLEKI